MQNSSACTAMNSRAHCSIHGGRSIAFRSFVQPPRLPKRAVPVTRCSSYTNGSGADQIAGPEGAFVSGQEAATRQQLFNRIAPIYDQLNEQLSFGQHRIWKLMTVRWSGAARGNTVLDVCCGSGDLAFQLGQAVGSKGKVIGLDFSSEMLVDAAQREKQRLNQWEQLAQMQWIQGDAMDLPFESDQFDAATMGYGLRNVASIPQALSELHRVLKRGSCVAILDFNNSTNLVVDGVQSWFLDNLVVPAARSYGVAEEYEYLRPSIKRFPTGLEQEQLALRAGFKSAKHYEIAFGLMGVLVAKK